MTSGRIRRLKGLTTDCPISAVTGDNNDFDNPVGAAKRKLGMSPDEAFLIFDGADGAANHYRVRLLEATGLEELHDS